MSEPHYTHERRNTKRTSKELMIGQSEAATVLAPITKLTYLLRMNYARVTDQTRMRWLIELREGCLETVARIDNTLTRYSEAHDKGPQP